MGRTPEYGRLKGVMVRRLYHQEPIITSALARILRIDIEGYEGISRGEERTRLVPAAALPQFMHLASPRLKATTPQKIPSILLKRLHTKS
jgi:hypothetical protein